MQKLFLILLIAACFANAQQPDFETIFKNYPKGCISVYDVKNDKYIKFREDQCKLQHLPASTFKIPNSMIGLETGVLKDAEHLYKWDGTPQRVQSWNQDHTLRTAFKNSAVWYYIRLAKEIGNERMQEWIDKFNYGNKKIAGAQRAFWLDGDLRISVDEQIEFLKKLYFKKLPVSARIYDIMNDIMVVEKTDKYTLKAKTGWADGKENIGWYVGILEENDNAYIFALNIRAEEVKAFSTDRIEMTREVLKQLGLLKN